MHATGSEVKKVGVGELRTGNKDQKDQLKGPRKEAPRVLNGWPLVLTTT